MKKTILQFAFVFLLQASLFAQAPNITYVAPQTYEVGTAISPLKPTNTGGLITYGKTSTFAGDGSVGSVDGIGIAAKFSAPYGVAVDASGNIYVADTRNRKIRKITPAGVVTTFAGSGSQGSTDGIGTAASFYSPCGIAVDASGNVYVADNVGNKIRKITPAGVVSNFGNTDVVESFYHPFAVAVDASGYVYVADTGNNKIRKITPTGGVTIFAGSGSKGSIDGIGKVASFNNPTGLTLDAWGNVYVADSGNNKIRKITPAGVVSTFAGGDDINYGCSDGTGTAASFYAPCGLAVDASGYVYVADGPNNNIRKITPTGDVSTLAGQGYWSYGSADGIGKEAIFTFPKAVAVDFLGNVYVADTEGNKIRKINVIGGYTISPALPTGLYIDSSTGTISGIPTAVSELTTYTITATNADGSSSFKISIGIKEATKPSITYNTPQTYTLGQTITPLTPKNIGGSITYGQTTTFAGDYYQREIDGIGTKASLSVPQGVGVDVLGNVYVGDAFNNTNKIKKITPAGVVTSFATGFDTVTGVVVDVSGYVYVADKVNNLIKKITPTGEVSTLAGSGNTGSTDGIGTVASFNEPSGVALDASGNVYVADASNRKIRKITPAGAVTTFAGSGTPGSTDGSGTAASFGYPSGITVDTSGNFYVADSNKIRKITPAGVVTTLAGSGSQGSTDGIGTAASFKQLNGLAVDTSGNVYVADTGNNKIRKITPTGVVSTLAGSGNSGKNDGIGTSASFNMPLGNVAVDAFGNVYVADSNNHVMRKIDSRGYTISPQLPAGLNIDMYTGVISGKTTVQTNETTYTITAANTSGSNSFNIVISTGYFKPTISYTTPQTYIVGSDISPLQPTNTGSPVTSYYITPSLPSGLNFNTSTGIISGKPNIISPVTIYTITGTNSYGSGSYNVSISTTATKPSISYATPQTYTVGNAIDPLSPINTGTTATYSISPSLPTGLSINSSTGVITGTPTTVTQLTAYTVTANNVAGSANFNVVINTVGLKPIISYTAPQPYIVNTAITPLLPTNMGSPATGYSISPSLSTGFTFNSSTGAISGIPTVAVGEKTYTITATNSYGTNSCTVVISTLTQKPAIGYTTPNIYTLGTNITPLVPTTNTGLPATSYTISPQLNNGLNFNTSTGVISGIPSIITSATGYTITATNNYGSTTYNIVISIVGQKPIISYTTPQNYTVGTTITPLQPNNTGSPVDSYAITPNLPAGLSFNSATGIISGTPTVVSSQTTYTVTATNSYGTGTTTVVVTTVGAKPIINYTTPQTYTVGTAIIPLQPTNTGSPVDSYTITPNLPAGLSFNTTTGIISGTSTVASSQTTYTVAATNGYGTGTTTVVITVNSSLGIEDMAFKNMILYPNPAKEEVNITNVLVGKVKIYNNSGQLVKTITNPQTSNSTTVQLNNFPTGIYYFYIEAENSHVVKQIIRQ